MKHSQQKVRKEKTKDRETIQIQFLTNLPWGIEEKVVHQRVYL